MKELPTEFASMGDKFVQEERSGDIYLYRRGDDQWEVVIANIANNDYTFPGGATISKGDKSYPSTAMWGTSGWTFNDRNLALAKFTKLVEARLNY